MTKKIGNAKENFIAYTLDSYKSAVRDAVDYSGQNDKASLKERLIGYITEIVTTLYLRYTYKQIVRTWLLYKCLKYLS